MCEAEQQEQEHTEHKEVGGAPEATVQRGRVAVMRWILKWKRSNNRSAALGAFCSSAGRRTGAETGSDTG